MKRSRIMPLLVLAIACGKQAEPDKDKVAPVPVSPKPVAPTAPMVSDTDKVVVINAATVDATEMQFTTPTGDKVPLAATKRLDGTAWKVDVTIAGKVVDTIDEGVAKDDPAREPVAGVLRFYNAAVLVAGSRTKALPRTYAFDARIFGWDAATKQVVVTKKVQFAYAVPPPPEEVPDPNER